MAALELVVAAHSRDSISCYGGLKHAVYWMDQPGEAKEDRPFAGNGISVGHGKRFHRSTEARDSGVPEPMLGWLEWDALGLVDEDPHTALLDSGRVARQLVERIELMLLWTTRKTSF